MAVTLITTYELMVSRLMTDIPALSQGVALQALSHAGRQFCIDSEAYTKVLSSIDVITDQKEYTLTFPTDTKLIRVEKLFLGSDINIYSSYQEDYDSYNIEDEDTVVLINAPTSNTTGGMVVKAVLRPTAGSLTLDSKIIDRYFSPILEYAKYYLLSMIKKPYSDYSLSRVHLREYHKCIGQAKREKLFGNKSKTQSMQTPINLF